MGVLEGSGTRFIIKTNPRGAALPPPDAGTPFELGPVADAFTAVLLADMVGRGEVRMDDPAGKYLPEIPLPTRAGRSITLEDLAMHKSGLPRRAPAEGREALIGFLAGYDMPADAGSQYRYSRINSVLLAEALANRAGVPYETLLKERVLVPLDLDATDARRSTVNDLLTFARATLHPAGPLAGALGDPILSRGTTGRMRESMGLGWRFRGVAGQELIWMSGRTASHYTFVGLDPSASRAVVAVHTQAATIDDVAFSLLEGLRESATPVNAASLQAFVGKYELKRDRWVAITFDGRHLVAERTGRSPSRLMQESELRFTFEDSGERITFVRGEGGDVIGLVVHEGARQSAYRKVG
jgi:CubicO group peptidase (beta-lactamase class C family)